MEKTALVIDNGLFTSVADRLARDDYRVLYWSPWENASPLAREMAIGSGLEDSNIFRCNDRFAALEQGVDVVVVPDLYHDGFEEMLRANEVPVFGPHRGQRLENDRWFLKEFLAEHGLAVMESDAIEGLAALREYIDDPANKDKFIKISLLRGDMETFHHRDRWSTSVWLDDLQRRLGPIGEHVTFICEESIPDAIEVGIDTLFRNGRMLGEPFLGFEKKNSGVYVGARRFDHAPFAPTMDAIGEFFGTAGYNCFFSNEIRITKQRQLFLIDATTRMPSPPGEAMLEAMNNFGEVVSGGTPDWGDNLWIVEIAMYSDWLRDHWLEIQVPKQHRTLFKFRTYCKIDGRDWAIPQESGDTRFGSAVGIGSTRQAAAEMAEEVAASVKAYRSEYSHAADAEKELEKADSYGLAIG